MNPAIAIRWPYNMEWNRNYANPFARVKPKVRLSPQYLSSKTFPTFSFVR